MEAELSREDVLKFYRQMNVIREMELAARELYQSKKIRGFLHLFVGQVMLLGLIVCGLSHCNISFELLSYLY